MIFLQLAAIYLVSSKSVVTAFLASSTRFQHTDLLPRAVNNCTTPGFQSCNHPNLPSNFCCPSGSDCILFNGGSSVVCCPSGGDCKTIAPLTCDITQQNAALHPTNQLHSTDLLGNLEHCGSACCPKGFSCQNNQCLMAKNATSTKPSSSQTAKPTTPTSTLANSTDPTAHCDKWPVLAILAGFFPGILLGVLSTLLVITCLGHYRNARRNDSSSDLGSVVAKVSDPIYQSDSCRSEFLRQNSRSKHSQEQPQPARRSSRARSFFFRSSTIRSPTEISPTSKYPATPVRTPRKEPSTESIKIYSPPNGGLGRPNTTLTDMMRNGGYTPRDPYTANS